MEYLILWTYRGINKYYLKINLIKITVLIKYLDLCEILFNINEILS